MEKQVEQTRNKEKAEPTSVDQTSSSTTTHTTSQTYTDRLSTGEILSTFVVGFGTFVTVSVLASFAALEGLERIYEMMGGGEETLWIAALFGLNAIIVLGFRDLVLPYIMTFTYRIHREIRRLMRRN